MGHAMTRGRAAALACLLLAPGGIASAQPAGNAEPFEPPVVGRPKNVLFSGAVGPSFKVTARATQTRLQAEDPLTLTVRVAASGPWQQAPRRVDLRRLPPPFDRVGKLFRIDPRRDDQPDRAWPDQGAWEFDYRLRPKTADVKDVPALPFTYYNPAIAFPARRWLTAYTEPVPLTVTPRAEAQPAGVAPEATAPPPDWLYDFATGPALLRHDEPFRLPGAGLLAVLLLAPPAACAGWYFLWRLLFPGAGARARRRRSRAGRRALGALAALPHAEPAETARAAAAAVAAYLQDRFELAAAAPAPFEVAAHLERRQVRPDLVARAESFFRACEAAQYAPGRAADAAAVPDRGRQLVTDLEECGPAESRLVNEGRERGSEGRQGPPAAGAAAGPTAARAGIKLLILLAFGLAGPGLASPAGPNASSDEPALQRAESAVAQAVAARGTPGEQQAFRKAARRLDDLTRHGAGNAELYRDQGNAHVLAGDLPRAVLAYHRGLRLAPNDRRLRAGLDYARGKVVFAGDALFGGPPRSAWPERLPRPAAGPAFLPALACYCLAWVAFTRWRMTGSGRLAVAAGGALTVAVLLGVVVAVGEAQLREAARHPLVVVSRDGVFLHKGNGFSYGRSYDTPLNQGAEVRQRYARGAWVQVELAGGEVGWLPRSAVLVDDSLT